MTATKFGQMFIGQGKEQKSKRKIEEKSERDLTFVVRFCCSKFFLLKNVGFFATFFVSAVSVKQPNRCDLRRSDGNKTET